MVSTETKTETSVSAVRPLHHIIARPHENRIPLCGRIPPWDIGCAGAWHGETVCPDCGGPYCPDCLRLAR